MENSQSLEVDTSIVYSGFSPLLIQPEVSLPCLQQPVTGSYPE